MRSTSRQSSPSGSPENSGTLPRGNPGPPRLPAVPVHGLSMAGAALILGGVALLGADLIAMGRDKAGLVPTLTRVLDLLPSILRPFASDPFVDLLQAFPLSLALIILGVGLYGAVGPRRRTLAAAKGPAANADKGRRLAA
jgi:hypothetical protein